MSNRMHKFSPPSVVCCMAMYLQSAILLDESAQQHYLPFPKQLHAPLYHFFGCVNTSAEGLSTEPTPHLSMAMHVYNSIQILSLSTCLTHCAAPTASRRRLCSWSRGTWGHCSLKLTLKDLCSDRITSGALGKPQSTVDNGRYVSKVLVLHGCTC